MTVLENLLVAQHNALMPNVGSGLLAVFGLGGYRAARARGDRAGAALARPRSACCAAPTTRPARCPTATSGGSRSRARCAPTRCCCASTSRPPGSTRARATSSPALLQRIQADGCSMLLIEHDMGVVMRISDHIVVLDHGQQDRRRHARPTSAPTRRVIAAYLGEGDEDEDAGASGRAHACRHDALLLALAGVTAFYGAIQALQGRRPARSSPARS